MLTPDGPATTTHTAISSNDGHHEDPVILALLGGPIDDETRTTRGRFGWLEAYVSTFQDLISKDEAVRDAWRGKDPLAAFECEREVAELLRDVRTKLDERLAPEAADRARASAAARRAEPASPELRRGAEHAAQELLGDIIGDNYSDTTLRVAADHMLSFARKQTRTAQAGQA